MASFADKTAKTAQRTKAAAEQEMPCPECGKPLRIVKRLKDRSQGIAGGMYKSCSACDYAVKL